jgi:hypothetical protein
MQATLINKVLQNGSASTKESFNYSETNMMQLHFSYILESEIKVHSEWSQTMLLNFK